MVCPAPAIVEPGANTTLEIEEDEFCFFQSRCAAFSPTVMIEQVDLVGTCSLYASSSLQNPGPLDPHDLVVSNEDHTRHSRSLHLHLSSERLVYMSVRGVQQVNQFTVVIWDMIFPEEHYKVDVVEGAGNRTILLCLRDHLRTSNVTFTYAIAEGNSDGFFKLDGMTGILSLACSMIAPPATEFLLWVVAQNEEHACHRGHVSILVLVQPSSLQFPLLDVVVVPEDVPVGSHVAMVHVLGSNTSANSYVLYSILSGNEEARFAINASSGKITVTTALDFETTGMFSLLIQAQRRTGNDSVLGFQTVLIQDVNEAPLFTTACAAAGFCLRVVPENQPSGTDVGAAFMATDPDMARTFNGTLTYRLEPVSVPFSVGSRGKLQTTSSLDRKAIDVFSFNLIVEDKGIPSLSVRTLVRVVVDDRNDNTPSFINFPGVVTMTMDQIEGGATHVTVLEASDEDLGDNFQFSITSTARGDFETEVVVVVNDFGPQQLSSNATLRVVFETRCLLQEFSVEAISGEVTVALLCSVAVQPAELNTTLGSSARLRCTILHTGGGAQPTVASEGQLRATSPVGTIQSQTALVRIHVPPVITVPPNSAAVVIGTLVTLTCLATGIPAPSYMWTREAGDGEEEVGMGPTLEIEAMQGIYTCSAFNVAGVDMSSAPIVIFGSPHMVLGLIVNFSLPDDSRSCHQFGSSLFQMAVRDITGLAAMTTEVSGSPLCAETACSPSPCGNGGRCQLDITAVGGAACSCRSGYTGQYCHDDINECDETPCLQGGTCANRNGSFSCNCPTGFSGFRCQYRDVCTTSIHCPDSLTCATTTTNAEGFSCENVTTKVQWLS